MKLTLHQLQVFQKVAQCGSVTAAATQLHMTQPGVSNILRQLEQYYDCRLTDVVGRKMQLTQFGKILVSGSQQIQVDLNNIQSEMDRLRECVAGTMMVGTVTTAKYFTPQLLGKFKVKHPQIKVNLAVKNRQEIITRLQNNSDDFVIMSHPPREMNVDYADFYEDELVIASSPTFAKHLKDNVNLSSLKDAQWIMRENGSGTRFATENAFREQSFYPKIAMEISDSEAIKQAIMADIGISVISKQSIQSELKAKTLRILPVLGFPLAHRWYLVKNHGVSLSPLAEHFYAFVNQHQPVFNQPD